MDLRKRVICGLVTATMAVSLFSGCNNNTTSSNTSNSGTTSSATNTDKDNSSQTTGGESSQSGGENSQPSGGTQEAPSNGTVLQWCSYYDLNTTDKDIVDKFADAGYTVEYIPCGSSLQYFEKLNTLIMSGDSPDMVGYEWQSFPHGIKQNLYTPLDNYIDINSPTWVGIKDTIESFNYGGKHYYIPYRLNAGVVLLYNQTALDDAGISEDPFELYQEGEWTWDTWRSIMVEWCKQGDDYYGILPTGFVAMPFIATTGTPLIKVDGEKKEIYNNMKDANVQRCQEFLQGLAKDNLVYADYMGPDVVFADGKILFAEFGLDWGFSSAQAALKDQEIKFVPIPRDANSDAYYSNSDSFGYLCPAGAKNIAAALKYMEICRLAEIDEEGKERAKEEATAEALYYPKCPECGERTEDKLPEKCPLCGADRRQNKSHAPMSEELYDLAQELKNPTSEQFKFLFDDCFGFTSELTTMLQTGDSEGQGCILGGPFKQGESYTNLRDSYFGTVEGYLEPYRTALKNL